MNMESLHGVLCLLCSLAALGVIVDGQSSVSEMPVMETTRGEILSTVIGASLFSLSPTATPTAGPPVTPTRNSQLSLLIGLPVGIGLAVLGLGACLLWLTCSAYCETKDRPHHGTASSNIPMSNRSGGHSGGGHSGGGHSGGGHTGHAYSNNSSSGVSDSRAFQPSSHAKPKQQQQLAGVEAEPPSEQVDNSRSSEKPLKKRVDHGSTFDITLRSPEPSTTSLDQNQQFEVSMQH